jgi:hypothetical protein
MRILSILARTPELSTVQEDIARNIEASKPKQEAGKHAKSGALRLHRHTSFHQVHIQRTVLMRIIVETLGIQVNQSGVSLQMRQIDGNTAPQFMTKLSTQQLRPLRVLHIPL